jgi:dynein heavy chain, axonemal
MTVRGGLLSLPLMPPSAVKPHYIFNMRELTATIQGVCMSVPEYFGKPSQMLRLWIHETDRVYGDRLVSERDAERFNDTLVNTAKKHFSEDTSDDLFVKPLLFAHFAAPSSVQADGPVYVGWWGGWV